MTPEERAKQVASSIFSEPYAAGEAGKIIAAAITAAEVARDELWVGEVTKTLGPDAAKMMQGVVAARGAA